MKRIGLALALLMATSAIGSERWVVFEASFTSSRKYGNPLLKHGFLRVAADKRHFE